MAVYTSVSSSRAKRNNLLREASQIKASPAIAEEALILFALFLNQAIQHKHPMSEDSSNKSPDGMGKNGL